MPELSKSRIDNLVRDLCSLEFRSESKTRRLITSFLDKIKKDLLEIANKGELEELRREVKLYFK